MSELPKEVMKEIDDKFWKTINQEQVYRRLYETNKQPHSEDKK